MSSEPKTATSPPVARRWPVWLLAVLVTFGFPIDCVAQPRAIVEGEHLALNRTGGLGHCERGKYQERRKRHRSMVA